MSPGILTFIFTVEYDHRRHAMSRGRIKGALEKVYRSKISPVLVIILAAFLVPSILHTAYERLWLGLAINWAIVLFIWHIFSSTYYIIRPDTLIVRCSIIYDTHIPVNRIVSVRPTRNPIAAPANSFDRLEIRYADHGYIVVSPKDKAGFIANLKSLNPKISAS